MSIDLFIYNKNKEPLSEDRLRKKLGQKFEIIDIQTKKDSNVVEHFQVNLKSGSFKFLKEGLDFHLQPEGTYWAYTYNYEKEPFNEYLRLVKKVAEVLGFHIDDPQRGETGIDPKSL